MKMSRGEEMYRGALILPKRLHRDLQVLADLDARTVSRELEYVLQQVCNARRSEIEEHRKVMTDRTSSDTNDSEE